MPVTNAAAEPHLLDCSEIFPGRIRSLCVSINHRHAMALAVCHQQCNAVHAVHGGMFFFFAICMLVTVGWVFLFVPETKGRTLESMDELFGHRKRAVEGSAGEGNMRQSGVLQAPAKQEKVEGGREVGAVDVFLI
ncbi:hypothetical protein BGX38DRAFT_516466 [Terfezia claveryi]|nr:hypothetical protein BGX38DRAFT_516466 [Terfezia claveryi]